MYYSVFVSILSPYPCPCRLPDPVSLLSVMHVVLKHKGAELHELEEEAVDLVERHNLMEANVGVSERELLDKVCRCV